MQESVTRLFNQRPAVRAGYAVRAKFTIHMVRFLEIEEMEKSHFVLRENAWHTLCRDSWHTLCRLKQAWHTLCRENAWHILLFYSPCIGALHCGHVAATMAHSAMHSE